MSETHFTQRGPEKETQSMDQTTQPQAEENQRDQGAGHTQDRLPTKEELKREMTSGRTRKNEREREIARRRKEARQELMQERVKNTVKVNDDKLNENFEKGKGG